MVGQLEIRRLVLSFTLAFLIFALCPSALGIQLPTELLPIFPEYKIWCDCNGDGIADIVKNVWVASGDSLEDYYPTCCCTLLKAEEIPPTVDPLPITLPDPLASNPTPPPLLLPSQPSKAVSNSIYVPYTDGEALISANLRKPGSANWYKQEGMTVDTGAGITIFPGSLAAELGFDLKSGTEYALEDVSGTTISAWAHLIEIEFLAPDGRFSQS